MYGSHRMKRATVILIALTVAVIYTLAMVACIMLVKSDREVLSGNISSSALSPLVSENSPSVDNVSSDYTYSSDISSVGDTSSNTSSDASSDVGSELTPSDSSASSGVTSSESTSSNEPVTPPKAQFTSAIWYAYYELDFREDTEATFRQKINKMFDDAVDLGCDAVICQVRPFADAYYYSDYFPMSMYLTGTQGNDPKYDPLEYMVKAAHDRDLQFHAWINPYRISSSTTDVNTLADTHPAKIWLNDDTTANDRYVLTYKNGLYFNPSIPEVQKLIINGVREIVRNYDVDGIHFDDYFYPFLNVVDEDFDKAEHDSYKGGLSLEDWRRANVNALISSVYGAVKSIDKNVTFGISPSYHISQDGTDDNYNIKFADIAKWMNSTGYIDYIAPQLYFGYEHPTADYATVLQRWISIKRKSNVDIYIGLAAYKIGTSDANTTEWQTDDDILARQAADAEKNGCSGVFIFSYSTIVADEQLTQAQYNNLKEALKLIKQE